MFIDRREKKRCWVLPGVGLCLAVWGGLILLGGCVIKTWDGIYSVSINSEIVTTPRFLSWAISSSSDTICAILAATP